jgi:hypothetical protein
MRKIIACAALALLFAGTTPAGEPVEKLPGYFALENLDVFASGKIEVDVDLRDAMIKVAAAATSKMEPGFADLLNSVRRVRVRVGTAADQDPAEIRAAVDRATADLRAAGWSPMATISEDDELVYVLSKATPELIQGLTVIVHEGGNELVLVNIAGEMDPVLIGQLISKFEGLGDFDFSFDNDD